MAGINTLQEIYEKRGAEWTRDFLSSELRITEKAEAYRFSFEKSKNGKLRFYGKNAEYPLNRIDRTVSDLYEAAITKIKNLPDSLISSIPSSHRFGFNWSPESGLTLTDINIRQNGKVTKQLHEQHVMEKWASLLRVKWGADLYRGRLEDSKINSLMESLKDGRQPILESVGVQKTYILKGDDGIVKIAPPQLREESRGKSHSFDLILMQIYEQLESLDLEKFSFRSARPDERYIEIVCEAFNRFAQRRGDEFLSLGIKKPGFLDRSGKFNPRWIKNTKTLSILESQSDYEYLLSIFLINLRKPKKSSGLLTESFVGQYNSKINEINEQIRSVDEFGFPEFSIVLEGEMRGETGFSDNDHLRAVGMMQSYFASPFQNTNEETETDAPVHECNMLFMNMGQFTNKVLKECERMLQLTGKSFALVHDESAGNSCLWGMGPSAGKAAAEEMVKEYPHIFECYESLSRPGIKKLMSVGGERKISRIYTGRPSHHLLKECESIALLTGQAPDVDIVHLSMNSDKDISECMQKEDYGKFKSIFPNGIQKFWHTMQKDWQKKAYY